MKSLWRVVSYARPYAVQITIALACMVLMAAAGAFYAFLAGPALEFVFSGDLGALLYTPGGELRSLWAVLPIAWIERLTSLEGSQTLWLIPFLIVVASTLKGIGQAGQFYLMGKTSQQVLRTLRAEAYGSVLRQSPGFFRVHRQGDIMSRLTHDANLVEQAIFYGCVPLVREPISVIFLLVYCFVSLPQLALLTFVIVPTAIIPLARFAKRLTRVSAKSQNAQGEINAHLHESLGGVRTIQLFNAVKVVEARLSSIANMYFGHMLKSYRVRAVRTPVMEILGALALAGLLGLLGMVAREDSGTSSQYISFFVAIVLMYDPLKRLGRVSDFLAQGSAASTRLFTLIDASPEQGSKPNLTLAEGKICFDDVSFAYDGKEVLSHLNWEIQGGSCVALVGQSGAGKSTMMSLLVGLLAPDKGRVVIDDTDIGGVSTASLREGIAIVDQDTFLFHDTIENNIAFPDINPPRARVEQAARGAQALTFVEALPQGFETLIGERGTDLSGGQRQRLALARALYRDSRIVLLDEATSALDGESEQAIQRALEDMKKTHTVIVIAHRYSTVRIADEVALLENGRIKERGAPEQLIESKTRFAQVLGEQRP